MRQKYILNIDELVAGNFLGKKYASKISKTKSSIAESSGQGKHYQQIKTETTQIAKEKKDSNDSVGDEENDN